MCIVISDSLKFVVLLRASSRVRKEVVEEAVESGLPEMEGVVIQREEQLC